MLSLPSASSSANIHSHDPDTDIGIPASSSRCLRVLASSGSPRCTAGRHHDQLRTIVACSTADSYPQLMPLISHQDVRNLPLPELALRLLKSISLEQANFNNLIQGYKQGDAYGESQPADMSALLSRLSDAWAWLQAHALIGPSAQNPQGEWRRVTALGQEVRNDRNAIAKIWAAVNAGRKLTPFRPTLRGQSSAVADSCGSPCWRAAPEPVVRKVQLRSG